MPKTCPESNGIKISSFTVVRPAYKIEEKPNREKPTAYKTMALNINSIDIKIDIKLFLDKAPKRPMLKINIATINIENIFILNDSSITLMLLKG